MSVGQYIMSERMKKAKKLLTFVEKSNIMYNIQPNKAK